ncbi:hypothetical protein BTN50_0397 [Candidatus Enterovibrio altilux]|uniref:Mobile element protein n=1 Tax=Candidatus Enterovibrio altilux TaxID=1927128 RepID=A0A291B7E9_9GAMM|nr:hypothetical protein BTN50_0397 [Candidatus Enterovibrio luxaltus]
MSLRNHNAQIDETYAMIKMLKKLAELDMSKTKWLSNSETY